MKPTNQVQLFENKQIRSVWDADQEEWYFSVHDVVEALTNSANPRQYVKKMRSRDQSLNVNWGTICTQVKMAAADGKMRRITAANTYGILRIIQSIPSPKAGPSPL